MLGTCARIHQVNQCQPLTTHLSLDMRTTSFFACIRGDLPFTLSWHCHDICPLFAKKKISVHMQKLKWNKNPPANQQKNPRVLCQPYSWIFWIVCKTLQIQSEFLPEHICCSCKDWLSFPCCWCGNVNLSFLFQKGKVNIDPCFRFLHYLVYLWLAWNQATLTLSDIWPFSFGIIQVFHKSEN